MAGVACRELEALRAMPGPKAGAQEIGSCDLAVRDGAVQLLLDQIRLALLDTLEPVRDVHTAPARSLSPRGVSARSSTSGAKHPASADSSCSAIARTKRVRRALATAKSLRPVARDLTLA